MLKIFSMHSSMHYASHCVNAQCIELSGSGSYMKDPCERLKVARKKAGFANAAEAARAMAVSEPTYAAHENGSRGLTTKTAQKYARRFGVDAAWLLYGTTSGGLQNKPSEIPNGTPAPPGAQLVPIFNVEASAGAGLLVDEEYQVASLSFPEGYLGRITRANPRDLAVISVKGDSMIPTLHDDDVVMLDLTKRDLSYDGLFVIRDSGDALLVKRIGRAGRSGHISVISDNREHYPPVERALDDIDVVGKVLWKGGKV